MPVTRTIEFLPAVFQTETNKKFLNATLDQLLTEPKMAKMNGYIGRKFSPTAKFTDTYINEPSAIRSKYQLEPSVVVKDSATGNIDHHSSYHEILQKLRYYGSLNSNQNTAWESEMYSYNPHIDFDKFINFSQYYWLPAGPAPVDVFAGAIDLNRTYTVSTNPHTVSYNFSGLSDAPNPDLVLARGGHYEFTVDQPGRHFWIQSAAGTSGLQSVLTNISSRDVHGVTNNGDDQGVVVFDVPLKTAQDFFVYMTSDGSVDYSTTLSYAVVQNALLSELKDQYGGIDGQYTESILNSKYIIFNGSYTTEADWTSSSGVVPETQRLGIWRIYCQGLDTNGDNTSNLSQVVDYRIELTFLQEVSVNHKVLIKTGMVNGGTEWYRTDDDVFEQIPALTAILDTLYYQDSENPAINGVIRLVDASASYIDVTDSILGKTAYTSPNGVVFTNGMKICFDAAVMPEEYQNREYYIEGVGRGITLTQIEDLGQEYPDQDYVLINRSSQEKSAWAQGNRWFHSDVIELTAMYNNTVPSYDADAQARRPIIEFEPNLQLFDFGTRAKIPVDVYDTTHVRPFNTVEGVRLNSDTSSGFYIDGVELVAGMRVIFAADQDIETRNNVWVVSFETVGDEDNLPQIHLSLASDGSVAQGDTVLIESGVVYGRKKLWFNQGSWVAGQQKTTTNQAPRFDVFDSHGISFGDRTRYPVVTEDKFFNGTEIFSYAHGTGVEDSELGFSLVYQNIGNIGDIVFENDFDRDTMEYTVDREKFSLKVNTGNLKKTTTAGSYQWVNTWSTVLTPSRQYQEFNFVYSGNTEDNLFIVDILPRDETLTPTLCVYLNGRLLSAYEYYIEKELNYNEDPINGFRVYVNYDLLTAGDRVDIFVDSDTVSATGSYDIPMSLELNAQNSVASTLTLSDMRNHVSALTRSATLFSGKYPGASNLRDLDLTNYPGRICQHSANTPLAMMFLADESVSLVDAIIYASKEYSRFKNKFLENATVAADIAFMTPRLGVDTLIKRINSAKNKSMPWFYSDMVPSDDNINVIDYTVFNPAAKTYEITTTTPMDVASNHSVIVYYDGVQLVRGRDYEVSSTSPSIAISDTFTLVTGKTITIVEFRNTDGSYVPETPSKLGLYPKFIPEIFVDDTYQTSALLIRGHDGSTTPAFTELPESGMIDDIEKYDFRDLLLLELETRIFNNIKINYDERHFSVADVQSGKFRDTGYTLAEFNTVMAKMFLGWIGSNRLDYTTNSSYQANNTFTWNLRGQIDKIGSEELPGSWRACYEYYYDTQTPHLTPWEMLGFSVKPDWWEATYGPAPYTGGNLVLWQDLERGYIAAGDRAGIDRRFARPGLTSVIPVTETGELRTPEFLLHGSIIDVTGNASWSVGARGPVETAWRKSSEYPFAVQLALAVLKPGKYFGVNIDRNIYRFDTSVGQYINRLTNQRLTPADVVINGHSGRASGYLNWISDSLKHRGIDPMTVLDQYIKKHEIKLAYHMAGFSDKKYLKILAEQYSPGSSNNSVLIPDSDYDLVLTKTTPVGKITYSAVIVEKTSAGYTVSGYDTNTPLFTVIPPDVAGSAYALNVLDHTVNIYKDYRKIKVSVPYGYEFNSVQQVSNFLIGYGLALAAQGFKFDEYDQTLEQIKNWALSVKEFLFWAQQGWKENSVLVLSPVGSMISADVGLYAVDKVGNTITGGRVLNQNFSPIGEQSLTFTRLGNRFTCNAINQDMIGLIDLNLVQYEHTIILNNTTMFNDVVFKPENGIRQYRLKLVGSKSMDWNGTVSAPGFVYYCGLNDEWQSMRDYLKGDTVVYKGLGYAAIKDLPGAPEFNFSDWIKISDSINASLLPNFAYNASVSESFYDVDVVNLEDQYDLFGKGLIGYRNRNYLYSLGLDDVSQVKFYQGFIKEKGTHRAFAALGNVSVGNNDSTVELGEEWAFRIGEYGALDTNQTVDLEISEQDILSNPFTVELSSNTPQADITWRDPYLSSTVDTPASIFLDRIATTAHPQITDIQSAGFPELNDVDYTLFDISDFSSLYSELDNIGAGTKIWCANDFEHKWNVFRVVETNITVTTVNNALDNLVEMVTDVPHGLAVGEVLIVKNAKQFSGLYRIDSVPTLRSFVVSYSGNLLGFSNTSGLTAALFTLKSMVFDYAFQVAEYQPPNGWKETDVAWVRYDNRGRWGTYKKITPWDFVKALPRGNLLEKPLYGTSVNLSVDNQVVLVGNPSGGIPAGTSPYQDPADINRRVGEVVAYTRTYSTKFRELATITATANDTYGMGQIIEQGNYWAIVGAPSSMRSTLTDATTGVGYTFITHRSFGSLEVSQVLVAPENQSSPQYGAQFGAAVSISQNDKWAVIGAPGAGKIYVYGLKTDTPEHEVTITGDTSTTVFILDFVPESTESISVRSSTQWYRPYIDFTVSGGRIIFATAPDSETIKVTQAPGFRLIDTISGDDTAKFGFSVAIATDGAQILASAPYEDVMTNRVLLATELENGKMYEIAVVGTSTFTGIGAGANTVGTRFTATGPTTGTGSVYEVLPNAGAIYVYDRSIEAFVSDGSTTYTPRRPVKLVSRVTINDVEKVYGTDYIFAAAGLATRVIFTSAPPIGSRVSIETNQVNLIERVIADEPHTGDLLGYNINLCPTNCSLYAGVPMSSHSGKVNNGAVIRFFNSGRQSGENTGVFLDPVTVSLYESVEAGAYSFKVAGNLNSYPKLRAGLRAQSIISGIPRFVLISSVVQTTGTYFTVTLANPITEAIFADTEITFERVPRAEVGNTIRINDFEIEIVNSELDGVVAAINNKQIPGVTARNEGGYLKLISDVLITRNRLRCCAGINGSETINALGLRIYPQIQFITNPYDNDDRMFGKKVRITRALPDYGFMVGSDTASTYVTTTFDSNTTIFDRDSTNLLDRQPGVGAVYMFTFMGDDRSTADFPPGKLAFAQQFVPSALIPVGLAYGIDFDIQDTSIVIGAPEVKTYGSGVKGSARVYEFTNSNNELGWTLSSYEGSRVDIDSVNKMFLWNKKSNTITETLDYIDPAKGKILGIAEQEIKYKTAYDPAMYNQGDNANIESTKQLHWTETQVGEVWWDLSKVRYLDYEHGPLSFRSANWGVLFPGSSVDVYEWVESLYLPSEYQANGGDGIPKHPDNSAYVSVSVVDSVSNREYDKYYFWVKEKTTVDNGIFGRSMPVVRVKELIENPRGQSVKYAAAIQNNAVALFNCSEDVKGNETVLHIDSDTKLNTSIVHSEWELVKESLSAGFSLIPEKIFNKLLDSLAGLDQYGNAIPDPLLPVQQRYGVGIRPRQGVFVDHYEATRTLVKYLNQWFTTVPLTLSFDIETLANKESYPPVNSGIWDSSVPNLETLGYLDTFTLGAGYKTLVENDSSVDGLWTIYTLQEDLSWFLSRVQSYDDTPYWDYVDWYADGYDSTVVPQYVVNSMADMYGITYQAGDIVKVLNDGTGRFRLLEMQVGETNIVGIQSGTIQFKDSLYNLPANGMGWNNGGFGTLRFDQNPSIELRKMLDTLFTKVFTESYKTQYGKVVQNLINYVLTEQKSVDWLFKTDFVTVLHKLRKLNQPPVYSRDNQETYLDYLEEVKPYSATVREYVVNYEGVDNIGGYITDFDVPAYYDKILGLHRSPSGEYYQDRSAIESTTYYDWKFNYPYTIETGVGSIILSRPGKGYTAKPVITITGSGTGDNAVAEAVSLVGGQLSAINVSVAGTNYSGFGIDGVRMPATVEITGGGLPETYIDFDTDLIVSVDDIIKTSKLQYFKVLVAGTLKLEPVTTSAGTRWTTQAVGDEVLSGTVTMEFLGEEAIAHINLTNALIRKIVPVLTFDRVTYSSAAVVLWEPNSDYAQGDKIYYRGQGYQASINFTSASTFNTDYLEIYHLTANDRIGLFYTAMAGTAGAAPALLQSGIAYPGVKVTGPKFSDDPGFDNNTYDLDPFDNFELDSDGTAILSSSLMDSVISSQFTDDFFTALTDTRPEAIIIDGGEYVDTYSSHAPEELIPGRVHETIDIQVRQPISPPAAGIYAPQSPDIDLSVYRVGDSALRQYEYGNGNLFNDRLYVYSKTRGRLQESDYSVDYLNHQIQLVVSLGDDDLLFVYAVNQTGINKKHDLIATGDGVTTDFTTQFPVGQDISVFVQVDGVTQTGYTLVNGPADNTQYVRFSVAPAAGSYLHIMVFEATESTQQWSEFNTQTHIVPLSYGEASIADYPIDLDNTVFTDGPFSAQVIVELNNMRLRPASCSYTISAAEDKYQLPMTDLDITNSIDSNSLLVTDVSVYVDGSRQEIGVNYNLGDETIAEGDGIIKDFSLTIPSTILVTAVVTVDGVLKAPPTVTLVGSTLVTTPGDYEIVDIGGVNYLSFVNAPGDGSVVRALVYRDDGRAGEWVFFNEFSIPATGSQVVVEVTKFAKFVVSEDGNTVTVKGTSISGNDLITVDTFSNHDALGLQTRTFVGGQTYTTELPLGFDQSLFDQGARSYGFPGMDSSDSSMIDPEDAYNYSEVSFDTSGSTTLVIAKFNIETNLTNLNYLWITLDGRRLMPVYDFVVEDGYLYVSPNFTITSSSVIVVTSFGVNPQVGVISYRQFRDITGTTQYLRVAQSASTRLLEAMSITDTTMLVEDPTVLPIPGIKSATPGAVFVNGERIVYFRNYSRETVVAWEPDTAYDLQTLVSYDGSVYDVIGDVNGGDFESISENLIEIPETVLAHGLGQVRRGTSGTGASEHLVGALIVDASPAQLVPDSSDRYTLAVFTGTDGDNREFSTTLPDPLGENVTTVMYITQEQYDDIDLKTQYLVDYYDENYPDTAPPYSTVAEFVTQMFVVYLGGMEISKSAYTIDLVPDTLDGNDVYTVDITFVDAPANGVFVAIELRTGGIWFDIGVVDDVPLTSALALSTTNQAKFLKEEPGFLI